MKSMMKKLLFVISFTVIFFVLSVTAFADTVKIEGEKVETVVYGDYTYAIKSDEAYIVKYSGTAATISTPTKLGGKSVVGICDGAYRDNSAIQSVTINAGVKTIYANAFRNCDGLQSVLISNTVEIINDDAFCECDGLKSVTFQKGSALNTIGNEVFYNDKSLVNITIPYGTAEIGNFVFRNCTALAQFTIPDSVTKTGYAVFHNCSSLESVCIGNGVTALPTYYKLYSHWNNWGNSSDQQGFFEGCVSLSDITFGTGLKDIGIDCFAGTAFTSITIPEYIVTLGDGAFENCKNLITATIGNGVTSMGSCIFRYDTSLKSVKIGTNVISIGDFAFDACDALESITIPSNVTSVGVAMFFSCDNLKKVVIGNGVTALPTYYKLYSQWDNWGTSNDYHGFFEGCINLSDITLGTGLKDVGIDCFAGTAFTSITIPDNVMTLGAGAFENCKKLQSAVIGNGVTSMGDSIFRNDSLLKSVKIGSGVISIGSFAFIECDALENIVIPSNVTTLGSAMFYGCDGLKKAIIGEGATALPTYYKLYSRWSNWGASNDYHGFFEGCTSLENVILGNGLISIGTDCFAGTKITSIVIPSKVSTLDKNTFNGATSLSKIYFAGNYPLNVGENVFNNIADNFTIYYINNKTGFGDLEYTKATYKPITVTFDNNDEDVFCTPTETQYINPNGSNVIEPVVPTAMGYKFLGWYKESSCENLWNFDTDVATKNITLYAKWISTTNITPERPSNFSVVEIKDYYADVSWDEVDGAISYNVYVNGKKVNTEKITDTSYKITGLTAETSYELCVTAVNLKGESQKSFIVVARTTEHTHNYDESSYNSDNVEIKNAVAATCGKDGYTGDIYCKGCGEKLANGTTISATGNHTWNSGVVTKVATCASTGIKTYTCTVCKATKTVVIAMNTSNHTGATEIKNKVSATCGKDGYTGDTYCKDCGVKLSSGTTIKATGNHTWDEGVVTTVPTCKNTGVITYTCTVCKKTKTEVIAKNATNHTGGTEVRNKVSATATTDGYTGDTYCKGCGAKIATGSVIKATGSLGDINGDGKINAKDARLLLRYTAKLETLTDSQLSIADVNNDGKINAKDARKILRVSAKLETM